MNVAAQAPPTDALGLRALAWLWDRCPPALRRWALRHYPPPSERVGVLGILQDERGRALLLRHRFRDGDPWGLPGGWMETHEGPADCLRRELREELGLDLGAHPLRLLEVLRRAPGRLELVYGCTLPLPGALPRPNAEILGLGHFDAGGLPAAMLPAHRALVLRHLSAPLTGA